MYRLIAIVTMLTTISGAAAAYSAQNEHNYTLSIDVINMVNGNWSGDAVFKISACPEAQCFHVSGQASLPSTSGGPSEGSFSMTGLPCDLHFQEIIRNGMDSGDWRIKLISRNESGNGCASLPPDLAGDYKEVPDIAYWAPDLELVQRVDTEIGKLPNFVGFNCQGRNISEFARYYWGRTDKFGHHFIDGQLRLLAENPKDETGIHIVSKPNTVSEGGCNVAIANFDADASKLVSVYWARNGFIEYRSPKK